MYTYVETKERDNFAILKNYAEYLNYFSSFNAICNIIMR